jgi:hypothetical protein
MSCQGGTDEMSDYEPLPPPTQTDLEISRYTYEELLRIAEELRKVSGVDFRTVDRVNKFGRATDCDSGTYTDIWDGASAAVKVANWVLPTQARVHDIASSSANDVNTSGSGAHKVKIFGLTDWTSGEVTEIVNMNGVSNVATANSYVVIYRMQVIEWGSSGNNQGQIEATAQTDGTITAYILREDPGSGAVGNNQTEMACYAVPGNRTAYLCDWYASIDSPTSARSAAVRLEVNESPDDNLNAFKPRNSIALTTTGTSAMEVSFTPWVVVEGPALIKIQVDPDANDTIIDAGFDIILD